MFYVAAVTVIAIGRICWRVAGFFQDLANALMGSGIALLTADSQRLRNQAADQRAHLIATGHAREVMILDEELEEARKPVG